MEENKKSKLGLGILIGLLIAIIIGLVGFIVYDKVLSKTDDIEQVENNDKVETENNPNDDKQESISNDRIEPLLINDKEVVETFKMISWDVCSNQHEYYHKQDKLMVKDMPHDLKQALAFKNTKWSWWLDSNDEKENNIGDSLADVSKKYKELFGEEFTFENIEMDSAKDKELGIHYSKFGSNYVVYIGSSTCETYYPTSMIIGAEKNYTTKELYIYENAVYTAIGLDGVTIYSDYNDINSVILQQEGFNSEQVRDILLNSDYNLDTFKYTFKQNDNGTYQFISVEKVK